MNTENPLLTVEEVSKLALPLGTSLVAGADAVSRPVRWALAVGIDSPLPYLEGGELLCLIPGQSDPIGTITASAEAKVSALVTLSPLTPLAIATAEKLHLPVFQLPAVTRIRDVERAIVGLLLDRQGYIERRSAQIYEQLIGLASENVGLTQIIHELARFINKAVVVQDKRLRIQEVAV